MSDKDFIIKNGISVNGTLVYTGGVFTLGNSSVNVVANSTQIAVGSNLVINTSVLYIGNSSANFYANSTQLTMGPVSINTSAVVTGSNVQIYQNQLVAPLITTTNAATSLDLKTGNNIGSSLHIDYTGYIAFYGNSSVIVGTLSSDGLTIRKSKVQTVAYGTTTNWDLANGNIGVLTLTGNTAIAAPTNISPGNYILHVVQDASGSRHILSWDATFKWTAGVIPTSTTTASARDIFSFTCDGTYMYGSQLPDLR